MLTRHFCLPGPVLDHDLVSSYIIQGPVFPCYVHKGLADGSLAQKGQFVIEPDLDKETACPIEMIRIHSKKYYAASHKL
jgi:hypothetical protein